MSVKENLKTILIYKGVPDWVREIIILDEEAKRQVQEHLEVLSLEEVGEEPIELKSCSGSGSLFFLRGSWRVLAGEAEVLDKKASHFSAGAAESWKHYTTARLKAGTVVLEHFNYSASPSTWVHRLTVYYRPPLGKLPPGQENPLGDARAAVRFSGGRGGDK